MCCRTLVVWHKIVIKILEHHDLYDIYWKNCKRIFLVVHILCQSRFNNSGHIMKDFQNTIVLQLLMCVGLWCFRIFILHFHSNYLNQFACRHILCVCVLHVIFLDKAATSHCCRNICLRFDVRILFNMKYMSSLVNLFGQEMQSNHEMDFTNFLLTAYLTLKLTEKLFQSVYLK